MSQVSIGEKRRKFTRLIAEASNCACCPAMCQRTAVLTVHYHEFSLQKDAGKIHSWGRRLLVPLYHPSPQVLITSRKEAAQLRDYKVVARAIQVIDYA